MPKRTPSAEDIKAAERLKALWNTRKKDLGINQYTFAADNGITQSLVSQYLNGTKPLNIKYVMIFATALKVTPQDIYPELFKNINLETLGDDEFVELYKSCTVPQKDALKNMLKTMLNT